MADLTHNLEGADLDGLRIVSKLGAGGMGDVWRAHDEDLDIPIAVKVLPAHLASDQAFLVRFLREARAVARLDHPNIVRIYQAGRRSFNDVTLRLIVMELVEGCDARELYLEAEEGFLSPERSAEIGLATAKALSYAHDKGIIHRDIKPANILIGENGAIKVADFGIAKLQATEASSDADKTTVIVGTPTYMPPEQARGREIYPSTDTYSLGITLYELLTGRAPFEGSTYSVVSAHMRQPLPIKNIVFEHVPAEFGELLNGMCAKNPADRMALSEVVERLESFLGLDHASTVRSRVLDLENPTNITPSESAFLGRDLELKELAPIVEAKRLTTILGPGGVGKTRFVKEFGLKTRYAFPAGVWFCDLTDARDLNGIIDALALGLSISAAQGDPIELIHESLRLRKGRSLVILDNFEQVSKHAAKTLGVWLRDTPEVSFLTTSREPLHLEGERAFPLDPLEADDYAAAIELFIDRATRVVRNFDAGEENRNAIREIVRELDGMPLAIELAAARAKLLTPSKILERLPRRFDLLHTRRRDASARQATLRGAIDWSWNLLLPYEQLALAQCSVFRGGFFLDAAEEILDFAAAEDAPFEIDVVESLCEKSLIQATESEEVPGEMRYRLLESVREYAGERMMAFSQDGSSDDNSLSYSNLRRRHAEFYVAYGEQWHALDNSAQAREALDRLGADGENLFAVHDAFGESDPEFAARSLVCLTKVHTTRVSLLPLLNRMKSLESRAGELPLEVAHAFFGSLALLARLGVDMELFAQTVDELNGICTRLVDEESSALNLKRLSDALRQKGMLLFLTGSLVDSIAVFDQAAEFAQQSGHQASMANVLASRAVSLRGLGQHREALSDYESALLIYLKEGNLLNAAMTYQSIGLARNSIGDVDGASTAFDEAERYNADLGNDAGRAGVIGCRGRMFFDSGDLEAALKAYKESLGISRSLGDLRNVTIWLSNIADVELLRANFDEAERLYREGLELDAAAGDREGELISVTNLALTAILSGRFEEAIKLVDDCLVRSEALDNQRLRVEVEFLRAQLALRQPIQKVLLEEINEICETCCELFLNDEIALMGGDSNGISHGGVLVALLQRQAIMSAESGMAPESIAKIVDLTHQVAKRGIEVGEADRNWNSPHFSEFRAWIESGLETT